MSSMLRNWIKKLGEKLRPRSKRANRRALTKWRPTLEILEERLTPSSWLVSLATPDSATTAGTLRYALANAQNGDQVTFASSLSGDTITLSSVLNVNADVTITGLGAANLAISGNNATEVFDIASGVTANISSLTVENGQAKTGGGILSDGTLTLSNSAVSGNSAASSGAGIVIYGGSLTLSNSTVSGNSAKNGGGIFNFEGVLTLSNSTVSGNSAKNGGGIFNYQGMLTLSNSTASGNSAQTAGGIFNDNGSLTLSGSTVSGNSVTGTGGGILNDSGALTLSNSTVSGSSAQFGAGIFNYEGGVTLSSSTLFGNSANYGGGIYSDDGEMTLNNSTVSGNTAAGTGGGVLNNGGTLTLSNATVSGNSANSSGGGIFNNGSLTLVNAIVAGNSASSSPDISGIVAVANNDLIGNTSGLAINSGTGNQLGVSAGLASSLASNGGLTQTLALLSSSAAIGAGGAVTSIAAGDPVGTSDTTIYVQNAQTIAITPGDYYILIDGEQMLVTNVNTTTNTLTVERGVNGTTATTHAAGAGVYLATDQRGNARTSTPDIGAFQLASGPGLSLTAARTSLSLSAGGVATLTFLDSTSSTPTGTVDFLDTTTNTVLGNAPVELVRGIYIASESFADLIAGTQVIQAIYEGDDNFEGSSAEVPVFVVPTVTSSTANLPGNSASLTINGTGFDTNTANDSVTFDNGVTGTVTGATGTSLTVSLTGLSSVTVGTPLDASVTVDGVGSGSSVQVATVGVVVPVVTLNSITSPTNNNEPTFTGTAGTLTGDLDTITVAIYSGSSASGTPFETLTTTASGGSYSVTATAALTPDGNYTAQASQSDNADGTGTSNDVTFTVDTTQPTSSASSPAYNNTDSFTVSYTSSDATSGVSEVQVYVSGATDGGIYTLAHTFTGSDLTSGGFTYTATEGNGSYKFETQATDAAGNVETTHTSADTTTVEDNVKPTSSASSPAYNNTDSFTVSYTSSDAISGVSEVQVYVSGPTDGGTYTLAHTFTGSDLTSGGFTYTATEGNGSYKFETQATDAAGNVETTHTSADTTTVEDNVKPTSSASSPAYNNTDSFTVSYTSSDAISGVSEVQVYVSGPTDGGTYALAHTFTGSNLTSGSFTYTATEGNGSYKFETQATDAAGNVETTHTSADTTTIEDTGKPISSASSPAYNNTDTFTVSYTSSEPTSGVSEVQVYVSGPTDGGTYALAHTFTGSNLTSGSFTYTATEGNGSYKFETKATDAAGNVETTHTSADTTTIEDTVKPTSSASSSAYNNTDSFSVTYTSGDAISGVSEVQVYVSGPTDGGTYALAHTFTGSDLTSGSFTYTATEGNGSYKFETKATDAAGNVETAHTSADTITIEDTVKPSSSAGSPASNDTDSFTVSYASSDAISGVTEVQVYASGPTDGGTYALAHTFTGSNLTSGSFTYTATEGDGSYKFETKATDAAGNVETTHTSADTTTVEDALAPTFSSQGNVTYTAGSPITTLTLGATGSPTPSFTESGSLPSGLTFSSKGVLSGTPTSVGTYPVTITAANGVAPNTTESFSIVVKGTAPSITSAASVTFNSFAPNPFTVTATGYPAPTFTESGALPNGVTFNAATGVLSGTPGASTAAGTYHITFTASNGINPKATQVFTLTVSSAMVWPFQSLINEVGQNESSDLSVKKVLLG